MKLHLSLPKLRLSSSRKARSKALTLSLIVGLLTFAMATVGERIATGKVSSFVVASVDLQAGQVLGDKDLKDAGKVSGLLPPEVFTSKSEVVGLSLAYPVKAGQPIVKGLVSDTPQRDGLYPGEVGVWVSVTLTSSGMAKPGDIVDVYLSSSSTQWGKVDAPQKVSSLQGVRVVAVVNSSGQPVKSNSSNPNGNVPAAVELAIPKSKASEFSQIAAGKVSLMLDPFATPQTSLSDTNVHPELQSTTVPNPPALNTTSPSSSVPNMDPTDSAGTTIQSQIDTLQPDLPTSTSSSTPNVDSNAQASTPESYNPPLFSPTTAN
ncbi:MAG TPA: pilus assembly protein CpaB [Desulfosporosinus sp.]|nr:pilus assembly protein CpaB [Desulfosporosinus sp.]